MKHTLEVVQMLGATRELMYVNGRSKTTANIIRHFGLPPNILSHEHEQINVASSYMPTRLPRAYLHYWAFCVYQKGTENILLAIQGVDCFRVDHAVYRRFKRFCLDAQCV